MDTAKTEDAVLLLSPQICLPLVVFLVLSVLLLASRRLLSSEWCADAVSGTVAMCWKAQTDEKSEMRAGERERMQERGSHRVKEGGGGGGTERRERKKERMKPKEPVETCSKM